MQVFVRSQTYTQILTLNEKSMEQLQANHHLFKHATLRYQHEILKFNKNYPLDYHQGDSRKKIERIKTTLFSDIMVRMRNNMKKVV